jgi:hypothetical protein
MLTAGLVDYLHKIDHLKEWYEHLQRILVSCQKFPRHPLNKRFYDARDLSEAGRRIR